jgi:hypothetical protein
MTAAWIALAAITISATSMNVAAPGTPVRITLDRWSSDDERAPIVAALDTASRAPAPRAADTADARGGRAGGRGRGGRGRGPAAPLSPIAAFTAALGRAQTIGYFWTNDITGYSIKYAWHAPQPDGVDRIILASDRRLGAYTTAWKSAKDAPETDYAFTLIELRVGPNGAVEGKTSLTNKIVVDSEAKTVALENYSAAPAVLTAVHSK